MLKDFFYLYFEVTGNGKRKYFLNYKRASRHYHSIVGGGKGFYGRHVSKGVVCFALHIMVTPKKCPSVTIYDGKSSECASEQPIGYRYDGKHLGFEAECEL